MALSAPKGQDVQFAAPAPDHVPAPQTAQLVAPASDEVPAAQGAQLAALRPAAKEPAAHVCGGAASAPTSAALSARE